MRNKVEILRAIQYTKDDVANYPNLSAIASFEDFDFEFMEEFKKVYELGLNQLEQFINKLDKDGKDLDIYSIRYYVRNILNGPLGTYAEELGKDKNYFIPAPNTIGINGNEYRTDPNTSILPGYPEPLGVNVDVYNKLPQFLQTNLMDSVKNTENVFRSSSYATTIIDNTLPIIDKDPQRRYLTEPTGVINITSHGNLAVKDSLYYRIMDDINSDIFDKVKEYLGEENFRIWEDNKTYNAFDSEKNTSTSSNYKIERIINEDEDPIEVDMLNSQIDSSKLRQSVLKIENADGVKEYELHTNDGQLGI